jgi:hypothetical protein
MAKDYSEPSPGPRGHNGRISEVLATTRFYSAQRLEDTLSRYVRLYNLKYRSER